MLSYTTSGDGEHSAVLFLHGFLGRSSDWRDVASALDDRYLCVAPDLPGHGDSVGLAPDLYSMQGAAESVLRVLDELDVRRAVVVGYSLGGRLALYLALRRPERIEKLFLESASPGLKTEEERAARRRADEEKARQLEGGDFRGFLEEWHRQPLFATLSRHEGLVERLVEERKVDDPRELAKSLRGLGTGSQPNLWDELSDLRAPTLAVAGELDGKFTRIAREMYSRSPRIEAETLPGAGHNVHVEAPEGYLRSLRSFLETTFRAV